MAYTPLCLLVVLSFVASALQENPITDFCRRWGHRTALVDGRLYIDGGMVAYNQQPLNYSNQYLLFSDINSTPQDPSNMPVQHANLSKPANVPSVSGGYLWADETNKCFYQFGGEYTAGNPSDFSLWTYDTLLDQWNSTSYTSSERFLQRLSFGAGTQVESLGLGYYYGGWLNNRTTPGWTGPQMATSNIVEFDFTKGVLKNTTGPDNIGRAEGQLIFLPASDKGVLVYFGGIEDPSHNGSAFAANMTKIHIYDIASGRWYNQTASGDIPLSRRQSCADVTWADDKSSFNIYLYGGYGFGERVAFNDVYILSLPSFKWIKGYPLDGSDATPDAAGHGGCSANVIHHDQMLVIGGWFPDPTHTDCDAQKAQGQHNMILGNNTKREFIWDDFDPGLSTYDVPPVIVAAIGGGPTGGATVTAPATWDHADLKNYYQLTPTFAARTATRVVPSAVSPSPSNPVSGGSGKTNVAAIAGGTVGGLVILVAILCLILFCLRRRRNDIKKAEAQSEPAPPSPAELAVTAAPYEMSTPITSKYVSPHEQADAHMHNGYSGVASVQSRSASQEYASAYPDQMPPSYGAAPLPTVIPYGAPNEPGSVQQSPRQQSNAELFFPDNGTSRNTPPTSWDPSAYSPQSASAPQRLYSYPAPTSPLQQPTVPAQQQGQVYYPPPTDPTLRSPQSQSSFPDPRRSPAGTQHSSELIHGYSPYHSTMSTPAQFYGKSVPSGSLGGRDGRGRSPVDRRQGQGRFMEAG